MENILIMMSTFNGEDYISDQLDSILNQQGAKIHLLIRDDGSTDSTKSIIDKYIIRYPNSIELIKGDNIGWRRSFFKLTQYAATEYRDFNYFAFADQDDVWLPTKIRRAIDCISALPDGPNLYCSNLTLYKSGNRCGTMINHPISPTVKKCLMRNYATGCTIVFNHRLLNLLHDKVPNLHMAHDYWCYMLATLCGSVYIDNESFILYRQHQSNQIGYKAGIWNVWKRRLKSLSALIGKHNREKIALELLRLQSHYMTKDGFEAVNKIALYRQSFKNRIALLNDSGYTLDKKSSDFWIKVRIILGRL